MVPHSEEHLQRGLKGKSYSGVRTTQTLVGLNDVLEKIQATIYQQMTSAIIYITGVGGVGKTRLLQHVLETMTPDKETHKDFIIANQLIDLYHTRNRSVGGLIDAILTAVPILEQFLRSTHLASPTNEAIDTLLSVMARAEQEGLTRAELLGSRADLTSALIAKFNQFTAQNRLVLAIDTAERLFMARDIAQDVLDLSTQRPAVLDWLLHDFLPNVQNVVVILAGRPEPLNLTSELQQIAQTSRHHFLGLELHGLREEEAMHYFEMVIDQAAQSTDVADTRTTAILSKMNDENRRVIFYCLHDGGEEAHIRPILLALALDHLVVSGRPLAEFGRSLAVARLLTSAQRRRIEAELSRSMVQTLREYRRPADEIILLLGWLRKGATRELLARLSELPITEVNATVEQIRDLSFVKMRPDDPRIFLHDEMYKLLQEYSLNNTSPTEVTRIFTILQSYYAELIEERRKQIAELYRPQAETFSETLPKPAAVRVARAELQDAVTEDLAYRLRWKADQAFQQYFLYIEEAIATNDDVLNALLRAELFGFLAEIDPDGNQTSIRELSRADVMADSAVRWVEWLWSQEQFVEAGKLADRLATNAAYLIEPGGVIAQAHLAVWRGYLLTYAARYEPAEALLTTTVEQLRQWGLNNTRTERWASILARAYNSLGYLYDRENRPYDAIEAYKRAIPLWRSVKLRVEEATTLNNSAFDRARIGAFSTAFEDARAGLRLREQLGPRMPVGLSVNTFAHIELFNNELTAAQRDAQRALEIFKGIQSARGQGLASIALAEATRRVSQLIVYLQQGISADLLEDAAQTINQAIQIFTDEVKEPTRLIEALREKGRVYRTWVRLRKLRPNLISQRENAEGKYTIEELTALSAAAFGQALALTDNEQRLLQLEIALDQAFLFYYGIVTEQRQQNAIAVIQMSDELLNNVEQLLPDEYRQIKHQAGTVTRSWYWVQSAIFEVLKGHMAYHQCSVQQHDATSLSIVLNHYLLGLTFHSYFSEYIFQERRIAYDQIYENLSELSSAQKRWMYQVVAEIEHRYAFTPGESEISKFIKDRFGDEDVFALGF